MDGIVYIVVNDVVYESIPKEGKGIFGCDTGHCKMERDGSDCPLVNGPEYYGICRTLEVAWRPLNE